MDQTVKVFYTEEDVRTYLEERALQCTNFGYEAMPEITDKHGNKVGYVLNLYRADNGELYCYEVKTVGMTRKERERVKSIETKWSFLSMKDLHEKIEAGFQEAKENSNLTRRDTVCRRCEGFAVTDPSGERIGNGGLYYNLKRPTKPTWLEFESMVNRIIDDAKRIYGNDFPEITVSGLFRWDLWIGFEYEPTDLEFDIEICKIVPKETWVEVA